MPLLDANVTQSQLLFHLNWMENLSMVCLCGPAKIKIRVNDPRISKKVHLDECSEILFQGAASPET